MKTIVILCLTLLVLSACIQFIGYRLHKQEFDAFYQRYAGSGHFIPPYVAFADSLGMLGTSLKAQWFLWILKRKKIKIRIKFGSMRKPTISCKKPPLLSYRSGWRWTLYFCS